MGRADDLNIQAESVVPPVIERGGGEHGESTPERDESSQRAIKTPNLYCGLLSSAVLSEGRREDQVHAGKSGENGAEVDAQVRGSPEGIPANGSVPRNVPIEPKCGGGHSNRRTPNIPGNRRRSIQNYAPRRREDPVGSTVCHRLHPSAWSKLTILI